MAKTLRLALDKIKLSQRSAFPPSSMPILDTIQIEHIMGLKGRTINGIFELSQERTGVMLAGIELTSGMGLNSWAGFTGTNEQAIVAGELVLSAAEVNPVIRSLQAGNIKILTIHHHLLDEQPRMFFLHFQGTGNVLHLARTLRSAFDFTKGPAK